MDLCFSDRSKLNGSNSQRSDTIKKEIPIFDFINQYMHWLIPKFTPIAKGSRLIPEKLSKIIIEDDMIE